MASVSIGGTLLGVGAVPVALAGVAAILGLSTLAGLSLHTNREGYRGSGGYHPQQAPNSYPSYINHRSHESDQSNIFTHHPYESYQSPKKRQAANYTRQSKPKRYRSPKPHRRPQKAYEHPNIHHSSPNVYKQAEKLYKPSKTERFIPDTYRQAHKIVGQPPKSRDGLHKLHISPQQGFLSPQTVHESPKTYESLQNEYELPKKGFGPPKGSDIPQKINKAIISFLDQVGGGGIHIAAGKGGGGIPVVGYQGYGNKAVNFMYGNSIEQRNNVKQEHVAVNVEHQRQQDKDLPEPYEFAETSSHFRTFYERRRPRKMAPLHSGSLADILANILTAAVAKDGSDCAKRMVCEGAATPTPQQPHQLQPLLTLIRDSLQGPPNNRYEAAYATLHHARSIGLQVANWTHCSTNYPVCPVPRHSTVLAELSSVSTTEP